MCPEILLGKGHNFTADIYCLGALLFELVTGMPPFFSTNASALYERIMKDNIDYKKYKLSKTLVNLL